MRFVELGNTYKHTQISITSTWVPPCDHFVQVKWRRCCPWSGFPSHNAGGNLGFTCPRGLIECGKWESQIVTANKDGHKFQTVPVFGDGSKPWYLVNPKIAGKWMFIPLKMVLIGIDPYPFYSSKTVPHWYVTGRHDHPTKSNSSGGAEAFRDLPTRKKARTLPAGELSQSIYIYKYIYIYIYIIYIYIYDWQWHIVHLRPRVFWCVSCSGFLGVYS